MNINEMPAGREMDRLVAERVMGIEVKLARDLDLGWEEAAGRNPSVTPPACVTLNLKGDEPMMVKAPPGTMPVIHPAQVYRYSSEVWAAWMVVERMADLATQAHCVETGWAFRETRISWDPSLRCWFVMLYGGNSNGRHLPSVICRAALRAVGVREV